jgi:hypothetical protein
MTPGSVGTSSREIARTPVLANVVAKVDDVVFKSGVAQSKNRFELCLGDGDVLQLRLGRARNSWHARRRKTSQLSGGGVEWRRQTALDNSVRR